MTVRTPVLNVRPDDDLHQRWSRRYWDSIARVTQLAGRDRAFVERLLWEAAHMLREDVTFAAALVRHEPGELVVEAAYSPKGAGAGFPPRGTRIALNAAPLAEAARAGRTSMLSSRRSSSRRRTSEQSSTRSS